MKINKYKQLGKGWHNDNIRHHNAKKYGVAGGLYSLKNETVIDFNLKNKTHLPVEMSVYVPSTIKDKQISESEYNKRIDYVRKQLSMWFGGYTSLKATGGYTMKNGKLVKENISEVVAFADKDEFQMRKPELIKFLSKLKHNWKQESIGLEVEGDMWLV